MRRRLVGAVCAGLLVFQWGCFSYLPVQSAPPAVAERVAVVLNDRGRADLAERLGAGVDRVEGTVLERTEGAVVLAVSGLKDIRGGASQWSGETVAIPNSAILGYRPRQLSKGKTALLVGATVFVIGALAFGVSLDVFGDERPDGGDTVDPPDDGGQTSTKFPVGGMLPFPLLR